MSKLIFQNSSEFFNFIPLLMQIGTANPQVLPNDETAEFYMRVDKKIRIELRKFYLEHPEMRQQIKRFVKGVENGEQIVISIKADTAAPAVKYLKESWAPVSAIMKKYMGE
jgi:hypothetical protein